MQRTGNKKIAVVGWGRGMGHTGHMYLADAVIQQAKDMNADPYFFVSKTVGKDDPIYPEEKIEIYQTVFPSHANIFTAQGNLNQALTDLQQLGYDGVVVVVGADQKEAFKYLENPNKQGVPVFQTMGFKKLRVISRQETRSQYAQEEGPRATPMREILMNPNSSDEEKFAVWRRDMPKSLSDDQVRDLMTKAAERMQAVSQKTAKLKEFISRVRPLLKEASIEQKYKILKLIKEAANSPIEAWGYAYNNRDQRVSWRKTFATLDDAQKWARSKNATMLGHTPAKAQPLNELGPDTLQSYIDKAKVEKTKASRKLNRYYDSYGPEPADLDKWLDTEQRRDTGIKQATKKLAGHQANFLHNLQTLLQQKYPEAKFVVANGEIYSEDGKLKVIGGEETYGKYVGVMIQDASTGPYKGAVALAIQMTIAALRKVNPGMKPALFVDSDESGGVWKHIAEKLKLKLIDIAVLDEGQSSSQDYLDEK